MNRRQFFARTVGIVAAATVGPDAIRQLPVPSLPRMVPWMGGHAAGWGNYEGIHRASFSFWKTGDLNSHAFDLERERAHMLRRLNADLFHDGCGNPVRGLLVNPGVLDADDTPDDPDY